MIGTLDVVALTHRGRVRKANEDCLLIVSLVAADVDVAEPVVLSLPVHGAVTVGLAERRSRGH